MYLGVDLGSTNIKAAIYDGSMQLVGQQSRPVEYLRENGFVEFDAERYYDELAALIAQLTRDCGVSKIRQIAFTGQAESLVCVDAEGRACMHAISWMDERSTEECKLLAAQFDAALCERVTGQQALLPDLARDEDPLAEKEPARRLCRRRDLHAAQGLYCLPPDGSEARRYVHRHLHILF